MSQFRWLIFSFLCYTSSIGDFLMLKAIFFDLDGTLLPMDEKVFVPYYFNILHPTVKDLGYQDKDLLYKTIWAGVYAMYQNDGKRNNDEIFWDAFAKVYGEESRLHREAFDHFYATEFAKAKAICKENPLAREIVDFCKKHVEKLILTTNPIFPLPAQKMRLSFIGLNYDDFDFVSDYENFNYCKPNPHYFLEILKRFSLKPEECLLFGNNQIEDGDCASSVGIKTYLVKGFIIYSEKAKGQYEEIEMKDIIPTIEKYL